MKKSNVGSLVVIIGLLILSVMTLTVIYGTSPETSVVLLDETFSALDKSSWKQEVVECAEDGNLFQYTAEDGFTADGILRVQQNLISPEFRMKREDLSKCYSCPDTFLFSANLETKNLFNASSGLVEVRAKFRKGNRLRFRRRSTRFCWLSEGFYMIAGIAIVSDSQSEDFNNLAETAEATATANDFAQLEIVFESGLNRTILKSVVMDENFHIYEIKWNADGISFSIDHKKVDEKTFELSHQARNSSNARAPIPQPFFLGVGVNFGQNPLENSEKHSENKASIQTRNQDKRHTEGETILEIDYVRLFRIESRSWSFI